MYAKSNAAHWTQEYDQDYVYTKVN